LDLLFKEIRFGISLNQQVTRAYRTPRAGLFCRVQQGDLGSLTARCAMHYRRLLLEKEE
jgi:hypothetical protein